MHQRTIGSVVIVFFFFNDTATTEIYTLSLHDALPIFTTAPAATTELSPMVTPFRITAFIPIDRKSTRLNSSHVEISYAVFCLKKKKKEHFDENRLEYRCLQLLSRRLSTPTIALYDARQ